MWVSGWYADGLRPVCCFLSGIRHSWARSSCFLQKAGGKQESCKKGFRNGGQLIADGTSGSDSLMFTTLEGRETTNQRDTIRHDMI